MPINTNINIPYSPFIDQATGRPAQEWLLWLMNPKVIQMTLANPLGVTSGGTGLSQIPTSGQLLIGNGTGYTLDTLTPGNYINVTNGPGSIQLDWENLLPPAEPVDFKIDLLAQRLDSQPSSEVGELQQQIDTLRQELKTNPVSSLGTMAALQQAWLPWVTFDTAPEVTPPNVGTLAWDGGTTLGVQMTTNVLGRINESGYYYIKASSAITKGQVVMFTGAVGASGVPTGAPATGLTDGTYIMGIAAESLALNDFGLVQFIGTLRGVNTSAYADGDILWYDPAVTGGLTKTKPSAPNVKAQMAAVVSAANNGTILIRVNSGSVLGGTDSNVQFGTLTNGDLIQYDSTAGYWKNVPSSTFGTGTVTNVSVTSANGFAGTVVNSTTTPAITISTSITGLLYGNGTAIAAATVSSPLSYSAGTLSIPAATNSANGYLSSTDWSTFNNKQSVSAPVTKTADFTVASTDLWLINNKSGSTCTVTLPAASSNTGRVLHFQNYQAQAVASASSNVVSLAGSTGTSILLASSGDQATLVSDGTNWVMTQYIPNNILLLE